MARRPILLLVNPVAGGKPGSGAGLADDPARLTPSALAAALRERGLVVDFRELAEGDDDGSRARKAADDGYDVVVGGGDGTVSAVATALIDHPDAALGILAMGSFNNVARGFGIPDMLGPALDVIAAGDTVSFDIGWARHEGTDGRPFFEAAGVGLDAIGFLAVEVAERRGWWRGVRSLWRGVRRPDASMRITVDEVTTSATTPALIVSNGPYHGLGFAVGVEANPTDGLLDVAVFDRMSRWEALRHFAVVARRQPHRDARISTSTGRAVKVEGINHTLPAHADGHSIGLTPITFEVRAHSLRVFA
jgi:diacylglycerol kinase family enzyme